MNRLYKLQKQIHTVSKQQSIIINQFESLKGFEIQLNSKVNPLTAEIKTSILDNILNKIDEHDKNILLIKSNNPEFFSAGGDGKNIFNAINKKNFKLLQEYKQLLLSFQLKMLQFNLNPNNLSLVNLQGQTIGGGYSFIAHSKYRLCDDTTQIYFPESRNGILMNQLYFFAQLPHNIGLYLLLTNQKVIGKENVEFGLADYYFDSNESLNNFYDKMVEILDSKEFNYNNNEFILEILQKQNVLSKEETQSQKSQKIEWIQSLFDFPDYQDFFENLHSVINNCEDADFRNFTIEVKESIEKSAPVAVRLHHKLFWEAKNYINKFNQSHDNNPQSYYEMALNFTQKEFQQIIKHQILESEFVEGFGSVVINKKKAPIFKYAQALDVPESVLNDITEGYGDDPRVADLAEFDKSNL
ncbi:hypothetical protein PPERSA_08203 [Pseudocohnilembus persalinus]|uniref:3-hydroxyisobutyryl-CoA hydrolase n=1 Tax=Pseudocohnilembus persalinus TaxID=266149 RepID=A0A0V0QFW6_PSEPJ|nr:hypothetical protein PPERSA_08203 [Pseudocohnilembus persalinus]|eukprot:KRX01102.1 hypothetical protein PPERSA_08203 [Pseudocohnilembus persalinus]